MEELSFSTLSSLRILSITLHITHNTISPYVYIKYLYAMVLGR